ncbi:UDP-N-acetyl-D-mannosamine dehydrogenase / UDP-glucose 6-dehydrogenase [Acanthocystis turfacea Chlorella virus Canal-1]|nr:UDP-N-acetyl-D-mannosamine dehydrogenase / UDP-glucose 6-dehydrogenase [Acanthocystis turfacea Chlorella virus Canal-1]
MDSYRVTVVGSGYVGSAMAALLSMSHLVTVLDIDESRVRSINNRKSPVKDEDIDTVLANPFIRLFATTDKSIAYDSPDFVVIATPTNYDTESGYFDTRSVQSVIADVVKFSPGSYIVIKSTIPIGFVDSMRNTFGTRDIAFSPEFLREGRALYDNLNPSRIIIGDEGEKASAFVDMLYHESLIEDVPKLFMSTREAESVKLFANTYLAMRVSFFNELDSFAMANGLHAKDIIEGITYEPRIGGGYCNPSFGYGGYCFPKDTKQLLANFENIPQTMIGAIVTSNTVRKQAIVDEIVYRAGSAKTVGIYRLAMKSDSDNFRDAAILGIMSQVRARGLGVIIYEPSTEKFEDYEIVNDLGKFVTSADVIVANRVPLEHRLLFGKKLFTRDVYGDN